MRSFSLLLRIIGLGAMVLSLLSCSAVKLGYNQLPEITYWWLDGYIDTASPQSARVREEIRGLHAWHRQAELPKVVALAESMQGLAHGQVTPQQTCTVFEEARDRLLAVTTRVEPALVWLVHQLTPDQLKHLERKLTRNDRKWREEWLDGTLAERAKRRVKLAVERSEDFYGPLQDAQLVAVRTNVAQSTYNPQTAWAERQRRHQDLVQTLEQVHAGKLDDEQTRAALRGWLDRALNPPVPAHRAHAQNTVREGCASAALVHNSTTPEQRERAVKRLKAYERDFRDLMGSAG
jgi:Family of unknown function (DUF6279)